jgi:hypothetical protein
VLADREKWVEEPFSTTPKKHSLPYFYCSLRLPNPSPHPLETLNSGEMKKEKKLNKISMNHTLNSVANRIAKKK